MVKALCLSADGAVLLISLRGVTQILSLALGTRPVRDSDICHTRGPPQQAFTCSRISKKFLAPTEDEIAVATAAATAALEEARTIADGPTRKKKLRKKKKRVARPCSAIEAAAQEAAVKTTFGTSGRGNASHWSWIKVTGSLISL